MDVGGVNEMGMNKWGGFLFVIFLRYVNLKYGLKFGGNFWRLVINFSYNW